MTCGALKIGDSRPCKLDLDHDGIDHFNGMDMWGPGECAIDVTHQPNAARTHPENAHVAAAIIEPKRNTRAWQVLNYLRERRGQWVPGFELATQQVGGSEGLKRFRELRANGHPVEERSVEGQTYWEYRLV